MRIGLLASNASLAEYFVTALGIADNAVMLLELVLDASGRQMLAELSGLAKELGLPIIVLTTAGRDAIVLAQAAFPELCLRQLPLPLRALLALIQAQCLSMSSATLSSSA
jgi:hypothetical protein